MRLPSSRALAFLVTLCLTPSGAIAQTVASKSVNEPTYSAGDINTSVSRVFTHVFKKTSLGHEHAVEGLVQGGHIRFGGQEPIGEIVFDMRSFQADTSTARAYLGLEGATDESMQKQVNANMRGATVLDVAKYPTAVFKIDRATSISEKSRRGLPQYQLVGRFTLHGTTRPLAIVADLEEKNGWTHLRCGFTIKQSSFGIKPFTKALGVIGVADQLSIFGDLWVAGTPTQLAQQRTVQR